MGLTPEIIIALIAQWPRYWSRGPGFNFQHETWKFLNTDSVKKGDWEVVDLIKKINVKRPDGA